LRSSSPRSTPDGADERVDSDSASSRHPAEHDPALEVGVGEVQVQEQAAALERLGQLARGVGGEQRERPAGGGDGAHLGHGDLEVDSTSSSRPSTSTSALSISSTAAPSARSRGSR
jgi:hypothetical protein